MVFAPEEDFVQAQRIGKGVAGPGAVYLGGDQLGLAVASVVDVVEPGLQREVDLLDGRHPAGGDVPLDLRVEAIFQESHRGLDFPLAFGIILSCMDQFCATFHHDPFVVMGYEH